jgi:mannose-6-phosphate isomerase-like protein (cupin superfamily)
MIAVIDIKAELAKLTPDAVSSQSPTVERRAAFGRLAKFRDGAVFSAKFVGDTPWERHPNGDELVHVVEGAASFHIMTPDGLQTVALGAGMVIVVPQGQWHRFVSPEGVSLIAATPLPTEHAGDAEPRNLG